MIKGLSEDQIHFIVKTIRKFFPMTRILAFGSRVSGIPKKYSDFDICLDDGCPLDLSQLALMSEVFEDSDLPIKIDISDYRRITGDFRNIVEKKAVTLE